MLLPLSFFHQGWHFVGDHAEALGQQMATKDCATLKGAKNWAAETVDDAEESLGRPWAMLLIFITWLYLSIYIYTLPAIFHIYSLVTQKLDKTNDLSSF